MKTIILKTLRTNAFLAAALLAAGAFGISAQTVNINCGGSAFTTTDGTQWSGDANYSGGDLLYSSASIVGVGPQDMMLYRSARAGLYGDFSYNIPVPNGNYTITLRMAEIQYSAKRQRVFNVAINGSPVLTNFDILANVAPLTPLSQQFPVTVTNGAVQIDVTGVVRRGILNAIQIAPASSAPSSPSGGTATAPPPGNSGSTTTQAAISINCGGVDFTASDGTKWTGDHSFVGGDLLYSSAGIAGVDPRDLGLYRSARAGLYGDFSYVIPMANGTYPVTLYFAEIQYSGKGERVFNVALNGTTVLSNFDILTQVPSNTPLMKQFTADVTNGVLKIDVTGVVRTGILNGIQVGGSSSGAPSGGGTVTLSPPPPPAAALAVSSTALTFSGTAGGSNPGAQTFTVSNSGGGTLSWTAAGNQNWMSVSPASGTNNGTISVSVNMGGMSAGNYTGTVTVSGAGATKTVSVNLAVASAPSSGGSGTGSTGNTGSTGSTTPPPVLPSGNSWYVSTSGSASGNGSMSSPWDLQTALNQPSSVKPGDTIWVRSGKYGGGTASSAFQSKLVGTASAPIIVRAYPKERVTIDAWIEVGCCDGAPNPSAGSYTWFWGLEIAGFNPDRSSGTSGPPQWAAQANHNGADTWGAGTKFINNIIHDTAGGISVWNAADSEVYGNIVYNVGGYGTDRGHGHDFYVQNAAPSVLKLTDNIGFNNFDMGLQAYGSSDATVQNIQLRGNAIFNSGILYGQIVDNLTLGGGSGGPSGMLLDSNFFYSTPSLSQGYNELGYLWTPRSHDAVATNNYFIGGNQAIDLERWDSLTFTNNTVYSQATESMLITRTDQTTAPYNYNNNRYFGSGQFTIDASCDNWPCPSSRNVNFSSWVSSTGLDRSSSFAPGAPTGVWTTVRPNAYEPGRANIVIFNWDNNSSVQVDLSASGIKAGDAYQIRDAQNWYNGPVVSGTYNGSPVAIPMSGLQLALPVGSVPLLPKHTAPQFGTFVLLSGNTLNSVY
jgi:hypothetical protein